MFTKQERWRLQSILLSFPSASFFKWSIIHDVLIPKKI